MNPSNLGTSHPDDDRDALEALLEAFGSFCSLEEIASAYCKASFDVNKTGEILCQHEGSRSSGVRHASDGEIVRKLSEELLHTDDKEYPFLSKAGEILCQLEGSSSSGVRHASDGEIVRKLSEESLHRDDKEYPPLLRNNAKASKQKKMTASMGTVPNFIGKSYTNSRPPLNGKSGNTKPLKIKLNEPLIDGHKVEPVISDVGCWDDSVINKDIEEFLFSMLGDGFKLSMDVIRDVLGDCGYNARKTMEELLSVSEKTLVNQLNSVAAQFTDNSPKMKPCFSEDSPVFSSTGGSSAERGNLSREVMEALFTVPERSKDQPKRTRLPNGLNRTRAADKYVVSNYHSNLTTVADIERPKPAIEDDEEDKYLALRGVTKQNWDTMKEYYEAAIDAFTKGDREQARYLLEQGHFYFRIAREANEKSSVIILETKNTDDRSDLPLDLHVHQPREALHLLKFHLHTLANNPSFRCLKVIVDTTGDMTNVKRKKMVTKFLQKESIEWTEEEGNPGTIFIPLVAIDMDKLSFVNGSK